MGKHCAAVRMFGGTYLLARNVQLQSELVHCVAVVDSSRTE